MPPQDNRPRRGSRLQSPLYTYIIKSQVRDISNQIKNIKSYKNGTHSHFTVTSCPRWWNIIFKRELVGKQTTIINYVWVISPCFGVCVCKVSILWLDLNGTHLDSSVGASRQTMVLSSAAIHNRRGPVSLLTVCVANTWTVLKPWSIVCILSSILRFKLL